MNIKTDNIKIEFKWSDVKDLLPYFVSRGAYETTDDVLIALRNKTTGVHDFQIGCAFKNELGNVKWLLNDEGVCNEEEWAVTHWMPIPELPDDLVN